MVYQGYILSTPGAGGRETFEEKIFRGKNGGKGKKGGGEERKKGIVVIYKRPL